MANLVGIVSPANLYSDDISNNDRYNFTNNYNKRILECGGIPTGILPVDSVVSDSLLEYCDSFLICGGTKIWPYHLQVVDYAVRSGKPLLGICMGIQTIHSYFRIREEIERTGQGDLYSLYEKTDPELLVPVENHYLGKFWRDTSALVKHPIHVKADTHLSRILHQETISVSSFHKYRVAGISEQLTVSACAEDGTIEAIEYGDRILGVQFHPECDGELLSLFRFLI